MKITSANIALLAATLVAGTAIAQGIAQPTAATPSTKAAPAPDNASGDFALVQQHCSTCHSLDQVVAARKNADEWSETMDRMVDHGMQISPDDSQRIIAFLASHYGPA